MYQIEIPADPQSLAQVIATYFYGCFPNFRVTKPDGHKAYYPYYCHTAGYAQDSEPDPPIIAQAHVAGSDTWATRAVCGDQAFFAAWDVDTTDSGLLDLLRTCLHDTYGSLYSWEQSASGVHVWLLWEGSIELSKATQLVQLLELPEPLQSVVDLRYPLCSNALRLPFPGAHNPTPPFDQNQLSILELHDIASLLSTHFNDSNKMNQGSVGTDASSSIPSTSSQSIVVAVSAVSSSSYKTPPVYSGNK